MIFDLTYPFYESRLKYEIKKNARLIFWIESHLHESASIIEGRFNPCFRFREGALDSLLNEHARRRSNGRDVARFRLRTQGNKGFLRF